MILRFLFLFILLPLSISAQNIKEYRTKLVYTCSFDDETALADWVMEGPGVAQIQDGKLLLHSKYYDIANDYLKKTGQIFSGIDENYYDEVENAMSKDNGVNIDDYYNYGAFSGGHFVFWNRFVTPENYIIECDFQSLSEHALHMIIFSATGNLGQDVFSSDLKKRYGVAAHYTQSDLHNYRISFFAPGRNTSNMRKSPGKRITIKGNDFTLINKMKPHHLKIIKYKDCIEWYIDGKLSFRYNDNLEDGYLKGGLTAIRLMVPAKGMYDNYRIYKILN